MKVKAILFLCLAASVAIWAVTEVQELGNNDAGDDHVDADDDDSIGEDMGVGRRGGFLSTTGSFQLSSGGGGRRGANLQGRGSGFQGNFEEDDDLGEDMGVGRRGGFLSTTGSFQLSSGGGGPRGANLQD